MRGMWVHDHYFPAAYAHATWQRMVPFFRPSGSITRDTVTVQVELRPFNDHALNRDLALLCERANEAVNHRDKWSFFHHGECPPLTTRNVILPIIGSSLVMGNKM